MKHYGDITKISGYDLPIVDVITGGSPCQDLSVAGAKAGLSGSRSKLFLEQIRIIKEMRERDRQNGRSDEFIRPRIAIWEYVMVYDKEHADKIYKHLQRWCSPFIFWKCENFEDYKKLKN